MSLERPRSTPRAEKLAASSAPANDAEVPLNELSPAELRQKLKAVVVDIEDLAERAAHDRADRSLTATAESMHGVKGFFKKMWRHGLAREYYRQKELVRAREDIRTKGDIYAAEDPAVEKTAHETAMKAVLERFSHEYDETLHEGETRGKLGDRIGDARLGSESADVKHSLKSLVEQYAQGDMSDDSFAEAKKRVLDSVRRSEGASEKAMYADNFLEIARQAKLAVGHGIALDKLDLDFNVIIGKAKDSIRTEANHNSVDKVIDKIQRSPVGKFVNEATIASSVAIAAGVGTFAARRAASSRAAAWLSFGGSALVGGAALGMAENKRLKEDRAQHARERAQGRTFEAKDAPRRAEMEKYLYAMQDASELVGGLRSAMYGAEGTMTKERAAKAMDYLADIEARIRLMDQKKIDLLSYSDPTKVEQERLELDLMRAQAKVELRKLSAADAPGWKDADQFLAASVDAKMRSITEAGGGIEERDALFNKMKRGAVAKAAVKGVLVGLAVGGVAQEAAAYFNPHETGFLEHLTSGPDANNAAPEHVTALERLRLLVTDNIPHHAEAAPGVLAHSVVHAESIHPATITANEYLDRHPHLGTHVSRELWYDNDTPKPVFDKNELRLWWGGNHNTGIDPDGKYTFSVNHMMKGGSYHHGLSANAKELYKGGHLKLLLSLSQGSQAHPVEVPIDADGNVHIDPKSEIGKLFFSTQHSKAHFLGRFAEVAQMSGTKDGVDHVKILATYEGKGVDHLTDTLRAIKDVPYSTMPGTPNDYVIDPPPIIPVFYRTPLEPINGRKGPNPFVNIGRYYGYNGKLTQEQIREYDEILSSRLKANRGTELDARTEETEYLGKQSEEYRAKIETFANEVGPMNPDCKLSIGIPVAGHQEANAIERTLSSYLNQTADPKSFEIVLFVNQPSVDKSGQKVQSDGTMDKIRAFQGAHPELSVRVMHAVLPRSEARIGNIRKQLSDTILQRSLARGGDRDVVIVSNDADMKGVAPEYVENYISRFDAAPDTDAFMGQLDWDPESYVRNPLVHVGTRLMEYISMQYRKRGHGIESSGANFAYRGKMYAAVGGYDASATLAEDVDLGRKIMTARQGTGRTPIAFAGARVSRLYTSSRRAEKAVREGLSPSEQWERGFSAFDDEVRKVRWEDTGGVPDYDNPEVVAKLTSELENIMNRTLQTTGSWWGNSEYENYRRRALGWLGVKYKLVGKNRIRITDASDLIKGLKQYSTDGLTIMQRKTAPIAERAG